MDGLDLFNKNDDNIFGDWSVGSPLDGLSVDFDDSLYLDMFSDGLDVGSTLRDPPCARIYTPVPSDVQGGEAAEIPPRCGTHRSANPDRRRRKKPSPPPPPPVKKLKISRSKIRDKIGRQYVRPDFNNPCNGFLEWLEKYNKFLRYVKRFEIFPATSAMFEGDEIGNWYRLQQRISMKDRKMDPLKIDILRKFETPLEFLRRNRLPRMGEQSDKPRLVIESMAETLRRDPNELNPKFDMFVKCLDDDYRIVVSAGLLAAIVKFRSQFNELSDGLVGSDQCTAGDIRDALRYLADMVVGDGVAQDAANDCQLAACDGHISPVLDVKELLTAVHRGSEEMPHVVTHFRGRLLKPFKKPIRLFDQLACAKYVCRMGIFFDVNPEYLTALIPSLNVALADLRTVLLETVLK